MICAHACSIVCGAARLTFNTCALLSRIIIDFGLWKSSDPRKEESRFYLLFFPRELLPAPICISRTGPIQSPSSSFPPPTRSTTSQLWIRLCASLRTVDQVILGSLRPLFLLCVSTQLCSYFSPLCDKSSHSQRPKAALHITQRA